MASTAVGSFVQNANFSGFSPGTAAGMALSARLVVYKVCWAGGCMDSDVLAGMDRAMKDGVHVLTLSIGSSQNVGYDSDSIALATFSGMKRGIFVSCSAGNTIPEKATVGNVAPWITTVGAGSIDRTFPASLVLGNKVNLHGVSLYPGKAASEQGLGLGFPLIYALPGTPRSNLCLEDTLDPPTVEGKILVCDRGINSAGAKGEVMKCAGVVGMILTNTAQHGKDLVIDIHLLPALAVDFKTRKLIKNYIKDNRNATSRILYQGTVTLVNTKSAPMVAAFSSRGPAKRAFHLCRNT